ncbi:MAG: hypothetical protein JJ913_08125 [Rhizobiaceae bacterium]|nr:hypothetical protein [Rhizobiaceae bacterium]
MERAKIEEMMTQVQRRQDAVSTADTPENEQRLKTLAGANGMKLVRRRKGAEGFAVTLPDGHLIDGMSLAEVGELLTRIMNSRRDH